MNKPTIKNIWAQNTTNRMDFTDSEISQGIVQKSNIISSQLNGVAYRSESFIELLQHTSAWNANKVYNKGDMCFVAVDFRTKSSAGKRTIYVMILTSNVDNNTATPLSNNGNSPTFILDTNLTVPLYYIVQDNDTTMLSSYANYNYWIANDLTMGDLTNTVKLIVGQDAHFAGNVDVYGKLIAGGVTINDNTITANILSASKINGYFFDISNIQTPAYNITASDKSILNAEWIYKHNRGRLSSLSSEWEVVTVFDGLNKWTSCDYIYTWANKGSLACGVIMSIAEICAASLGGGRMVASSGGSGPYMIGSAINISGSIDEYNNPFTYSFWGSGSQSNGATGFRKK